MRAYFGGAVYSFRTSSHARVARAIPWIQAPKIPTHSTTPPDEEQRQSRIGGDDRRTHLGEDDAHESSDED